jgi:beta-galactosidase/beta-glucuronidase
VWYRKHFQLDAVQAGRKVFIEFEGVRQAAEVFVNGTSVDLYENGVTPFGFDISSFVKFGSCDNVIAVKANNRTDYAEKSLYFNQSDSCLVMLGRYCLAITSFCQPTIFHSLIVEMPEVR